MKKIVKIVCDFYCIFCYVTGLFGAMITLQKSHTGQTVTILLSPSDPIVNVSCKNCCVGSLSKIFHPNMMLIYYSWHKLTSFLNSIFIDKFSLFWIEVKDLQEYLRLSSHWNSIAAKPHTLLQIFNHYPEQWKLINEDAV